MKPLFTLPIKFAVLLAMVCMPAHAACLWPQAPYIPDAAASTEVFAGAHHAVLTYLRDLDDAVSCLKNEMEDAKPLQAKLAHDEYERTMILMRQAVEEYNTALAHHEAAS